MGSYTLAVVLGTIFPDKDAFGLIAHGLQESGEAKIADTTQEAFRGAEERTSRARASSEKV